MINKDIIKLLLLLVNFFIFCGQLSYFKGTLPVFPK